MRLLAARNLAVMSVACLGAQMLGGPAARAQDKPVPEQIVDVMNRLWGQHPGMRANHAKGVVVEGSFAPSPDGAALSASPLFAGGPVPLTVRFSDATGIPTIADGSPQANPHGMAVKFKLPDGGEMDIVANSLKFFPVATGEEFRDMLQAAAESGPGAPKPTRLEQFVAAHPAALKAVQSVQTPTSLARETYNGIDAFVFVSRDGKRQPFRFRIDPDEGAEHLDAEAAAAKQPDFLMKEIAERVSSRPVVFHLKAQLAQAGDPTSDPTKPWPEDRRIVELGRITLTRPAPDSATAEKSLLFLPQNLTAGVAQSDDPLIDARNAAYAVSFGRRQ